MTTSSKSWYTNPFFIRVLAFGWVTVWLALGLWLVTKLGVSFSFWRVFAGGMLIYLLTTFVTDTASQLATKWFRLARHDSRSIPNRSVEERLDELERLKRREMVTSEEYAAKRAEILKDL